MNRNFFYMIEKDEYGYFVATVPELPGCHAQARSLDDLELRIKEAIQLYLNQKKDFEVTSRFVGVQQVEVAIP